MKINIIHPKVYGTDGKIMELGSQEVDDKIAEKLIARGVAVKPETKTKK